MPSFALCESSQRLSSSERDDRRLLGAGGRGRGASSSSGVGAGCRPRRDRRRCCGALPGTPVSAQGLVVAGQALGVGVDADAGFGRDGSRAPGRTPRRPGTGRDCRGGGKDPAEPLVRLLDSRSLGAFRIPLRFPAAGVGGGVFQRSFRSDSNPLAPRAAGRSLFPASLDARLRRPSPRSPRTPRAAPGSSSSASTAPTPSSPSSGWTRASCRTSRSCATQGPSRRCARRFRRRRRSPGRPSRPASIPAGTSIFDFLKRDPKTYRPSFAAFDEGIDAVPLRRAQRSGASAASPARPCRPAGLPARSSSSASADATRARSPAVVRGRRRRRRLLALAAPLAAREAADRHQPPAGRDLLGDPRRGRQAGARDAHAGDLPARAVPARRAALRARHARPLGPHRQAVLLHLRAVLPAQGRQRLLDRDRRARWTTRATLPTEIKGPPNKLFPKQGGLHHDSDDDRRRRRQVEGRHRGLGRQARAQAGTSGAPGCASSSRSTR